MPEKDLVGVHGKDLRFGKAALDLDGKQNLLELTVNGLFGREKEVASQLHGQGRSALHACAGSEVAVSSPDSSPQIDAKMLLEVLVFCRNDGVAQDFREVVVAGDNAPLQSERTNNLSLVVVEFSDGAGPVAFKLGHFRKIRGINQEDSRKSTDYRSQRHQHREDDPAGDPLLASSWRCGGRRFCENGIH